MSTLTGTLSILRPTQWLKNLMLFFPSFLGGELLLPGLLARGMVPFVAFCLASSSTYVLNDILDRERDKSHPRKSKRPIPSGMISHAQATALYFVLLFSALFIAFTVSPVFIAILIAYLLVSVSYSFYLKHLPIIDLFCVSAGFLFRLQAGGEAFGVEITSWLFLSVFLLAIFLSTGKRLYEKNALGEKAGNHRKVTGILSTGISRWDNVYDWRCGSGNVYPVCYRASRSHLHRSPLLFRLASVHHEG